MANEDNLLYPSTPALEITGSGNYGTARTPIIESPITGNVTGTSTSLGGLSSLGELLGSLLGGGSVFNGNKKGVGQGLTGADYLSGFGNILGGLAGIGAYFNGKKQLGLARDQLNMQRNVYLDNRNTQANLLNQSLQDRLNTRYLQNTGSTEGAGAEYERRKLSMLNSI